MVSSLRSFFRYLRHTGEIDTDLAAAFLPYRFIRFPQFLDFCRLAPLRRSCGGPFELSTGGAIARF
jgi:hypothetical protein